MIQGFIGLYCDGEACADDDEPQFLEWGYKDSRDLRRHAAEEGWIHVPSLGRPWGEGADYCPVCGPKHQPPPKPENTVEVRG